MRFSALIALVLFSLQLQAKGKKDEFVEKNYNVEEFYQKSRKTALKPIYRPHILGSKGYRSSSIAIGFGDKTPGVGFVYEYSWDRLSIGAAYAFRTLGTPRATTNFTETSTSTTTTTNEITAQNILSGYFAYYLSPYYATPYFLIGMQYGVNTYRGMGFMGGAGLEFRLFSGVFMSLGYTYHYVEAHSFPGVSLGWAF